MDNYTPTARLRWRAITEDEFWKSVDVKPALRGGRHNQEWYQLQQWWSDPTTGAGEWRDIEVANAKG